MFLRVDTQFAENGVIVVVTHVQDGDQEVKNFVFAEANAAYKFILEVHKEFLKSKDG